MNHATNSFREATAGLWRNNVALAQLLGLCPLLAVSTSLVNGLALGVMTTAVLVVANTAMSLMRRVLLPAVRVPLYLLLLAALVTSLDLLTHAMFYELARSARAVRAVDRRQLRLARARRDRRQPAARRLRRVVGGRNGLRLHVRAHGARRRTRAARPWHAARRHRNADRRSRRGAQRRPAIRRHAGCDSPAGRLFRLGAAARATQPFDARPRRPTRCLPSRRFQRRRGERGATPEDLRTFRSCQPGARHRARLRHAVRAARGGRAVGASDGRQRQQGDGEAVPRGEHAVRPARRSAKKA